MTGLNSISIDSHSMWFFSLDTFIGEIDHIGRAKFPSFPSFPLLCNNIPLCDSPTIHPAADGMWAVSSLGH